MSAAASVVPIPLRRLQAYARRESYANRAFSGRYESVCLQASVQTVETLDNYGGMPEVILMGRANSGKSTVINEIFRRRELAEAGLKAGLTQCLNFYRLRKRLMKKPYVPSWRPEPIGAPPEPPWTIPELFIVDAPGYGDRGRKEWGKLFEYYIRNRRELRRIYILINAEHGVTPYDKLMLENLDAASRSGKFTLQAILSKCDRVPHPILRQVVAHRQQAISECAPSCLPAIPIAVGGGSKKFGFRELRHSILDACGFGLTTHATIAR